jgi:hypothetical protein
VIVHYFHVVRISVAPDKTNAVPVVDADTVLAFPVSAQAFQTVARRHEQVFQPQRGVQDVQFLQTLPVELGGQALALARRPQSFGIPITESGNHGS